jgi:Cu/Ag efflux protein CusF
MKLHALAKAMTLATLMSAASFSALAADIPLSEVVIADQVDTKVVSVDAPNHQVVLEGPQGHQVHVQLTDQAKDLGNLKPGDKVNIAVVRSVAAYLDTDVDKGLPGSLEREGVNRATKDNPNPGGEAYRQVQVQLQITKIDVKNNKVTLKGPEGESKTVDVVRPEVQAKLKDLKVGQSVVVTYTDVLKVTTTR